MSKGLTLLRVAVKATELSVPSVRVPPVDQVTAVSSSSIKSIDSVFWLLFILASASSVANVAVSAINSVGSSSVFAAPSLIVIEAEEEPAGIVNVVADKL